MTGSETSMDDLQFDLRALVAEVWKRRFRILFVTALLCALTYAVLLFVPKEYESSASLLVEPRENIFVRATNDTASSLGGVTDDVIVSSQVELIQSGDTLLRVVRELDLGSVEEFGGLGSAPLDVLKRMIRPANANRDVEQIALARLTKKLTVVRQRDSRVVSILVRSQDRQLAARIANAIASAHVNRRAEQSVDDTAEARQWLEIEIDDLRTRVSGAEREVAQYRVDNDLFVGPNNTSLLDQQMSDISGQITAAQERKNTASSRAKLIRDLLNAGQPIDGVPDVRESVVIQRLSEDKATLQGERAQLSASLLSNHPDILAVTAQIAEINNQITLEGRRVADALEAEARIEASLAQTLSDDLTRLKIGAANASSANVSLLELEREAKAERELLETYLSRFRDAASRTDTNAALPDVRVITFAVPALSPVSPKSNLILVAVLLVSLTLQVGSIMFREISFAPARTGQGSVDGPERSEPGMPAPASANAAVYSQEAPESVHPLAADTPTDISEGESVSDLPSAEKQPGLLRGLLSQLASAATPHTADTVQQTEAQGAGSAHANEDGEPKSSASHDASLSAMSIATTDHVSEPSLAAPADQAANSAGSLPVVDEISTVAASLVSGREHTILLLALDHAADCAGIAERLIISVLDNGLSVALVDAGSGSVSAQLGITDLSANRAEFGDVVQTSDIDGLSEVCWGTLPRMSRQSTRPATLVEALGDIYEVVIVMTGTAGAGSNLHAFEGVKAGLLLASGGEVDRAHYKNISSHAVNWGFDRHTLVRARSEAFNVA